LLIVKTDCCFNYRAELGGKVVNYDYRMFLKEALVVHCLGGIMVILLNEDVWVVSYTQVTTIFREGRKKRGGG
jgi:hypothetical protein